MMASWMQAVRAIADAIWPMPRCTGCHEHGSAALPPSIDVIFGTLTDCLVGEGPGKTCGDLRPLDLDWRESPGLINSSDRAAPHPLHRKPAYAGSSAAPQRAAAVDVQGNGMP